MARLILLWLLLSLSLTSPLAFAQTICRGYVHVSQGDSIYYESEGEGIPVVLLHGHTLDLRMWDPQMPALLAAHYRVVRPDLRGYGHSSPQREGVQFTHLDDVVTLLDSLHLGRVHLVGLSMGSFVASEMLAMHPERLLSATLASGNIRKRPGPSTPFSQVEIDAFESELKVNRAKGLAQWKEEWIEKLIAGGGTYREQIRASLTQQVLDWDGYKVLHHEARLYYANEAMDSLKVKCPDVPTLILSGELEHKSPRNSMLRYLPQGRQVTIPDCGHMTNMERPELFNTLLLEHINSSNVSCK